jgi:hypothetical protein
MRHLFILAILVGTAHAETRVSVRWGKSTEPHQPSALVRLHGVDDATVDRVAATIHSDAKCVYATLTFRISTRHRDARAIRVPIELSNGTFVTGMAYSLGGEPAINAITRDAAYALSSFTTIVQREQDPALLRRTMHDFNRDMFELAVFPITRGMPAVVTVEMTLPPASRLVLDPGPRRAQQTFELPVPPEAFTIERGSGSFVDGTTSLYAGDEPLPVPVIAHRPHVRPTVTISDRRYQLRVAIRDHGEQLGHCYDLARLVEPTMSSRIQLTIEIAAKGSVDAVDLAEVGNEDVRRCLVEEISSWRFSETDHTRQVRQVLELDNLE